MRASIGSVIPNLNQLSQFSDDSRITTRIDKKTQQPSLIVLEGAPSCRDSLRAYLYPETTQKENQAAIKLMSEVIAKEHGLLAAIVFAQKIPLLGSSSRGLKIADLRLVAQGDLFAAVKERAIKECSDKSLATELYAWQFKKEDGTCKIPTTKELESYHKTANEIVAFKKNSEITESLFNSQIKQILLEKKPVTEGQLHRLKFLSRCFNQGLAKVLYEHHFKQKDGSYKIPTPRERDACYTAFKIISASPPLDEAIAIVLYDHQFKEEDESYKKPMPEEVAIYNKASQKINGLKKDSVAARRLTALAIKTYLLGLPSKSLDQLDYDALLDAVNLVKNSRSPYIKKLLGGDDIESKSSSGGLSKNEFKRSSQPSGLSAESHQGKGQIITQRVATDAELKEQGLAHDV